VVSAADTTSCTLPTQAVSHAKDYVQGQTKQQSRTWSQNCLFASISTTAVPPKGRLLGVK